MAFAVNGNSVVGGFCDPLTLGSFFSRFFFVVLGIEVTMLNLFFCRVESSSADQAVFRRWEMQHLVASST